MKTRLRQRFPSTRILLLSLFIAAIGFGCGGGGGGGTPTYTIGGSVTGLTGTGFVLQNNGGNDLAVSSNGSFTFTTGLTSNTSYSVSIKTQPKNQICTVTSGSGTVANSKITNVSIGCVFKDQDASGLYTTNGSGSGTFKNVAAGQPDVVESLTDIKGMVYGALPNQKFIFFDAGTNVLYDGIITSITRDQFIGTATVYHDGVVVEDGVTAGTAAKVTVHGSIISRSNIDMTLDPSGNFNGGSIKGLFSSEYDKAATNARILADGTLAKPYFKGFVLMAIPKMFVDNFDGSQNPYLFSSVRLGPTSQCNHSGNTELNKVKNIYILSLGKVVANTNCTITLTNYTGFASVVDGVGTDTRVWYAVTNGSNSIFAVFNKQ